MLPTRAYSNDLPPFSPGGRPSPSVVTPDAPSQPALLIAAAAPEAAQIGCSSFTRLVAHTTADAVRAMERTTPRVVAVDWDAEQVDGATVCAAAKRFAYTGILVVSADPQRVPAALKAWCHAVLLRPFAPNLLAARLGRLSREIPTTPAALRGLSALQLVGTNRTWPETTCPRCHEGHAVSFEFSSYRRMWYACLPCEHVWLGPRQE